jgi:hypothetical protein
MTSRLQQPRRPSSVGDVTSLQSSGQRRTSARCRGARTVWAAIPTTKEERHMAVNNSPSRATAADEGQDRDFATATRVAMRSPQRAPSRHACPNSRSHKSLLKGPPARRWGWVGSMLAVGRPCQPSLTLGVSSGAPTGSWSQGPHPGGDGLHVARSVRQHRHDARPRQNDRRAAGSASTGGSPAREATPLRRPGQSAGPQSLLSGSSHGRAS